MIGVILAIVLPLTLKDSSDGGGGDNPGPGPGPGPTPLDPFDYPEYNPYYVDPTTIKSTVFKSEFIVKTKQ